MMFKCTAYLKGQHRVSVTAKLGSVREQVWLGTHSKR